MLRAGGSTWSAAWAKKGDIATPVGYNGYDRRPAATGPPGLEGAAALVAGSGGQDVRPAGPETVRGTGRVPAPPLAAADRFHRRPCRAGREGTGRRQVDRRHGRQP